jgi:hypothetical protein
MRICHVRWCAPTHPRGCCAGLAGGLACVAFLALGTLGEQVTTRLEVANEERNAEDVADQTLVQLPDGVSYCDLRIGAGSQPRRGDLVVLDYRFVAGMSEAQSCRRAVAPNALPV